MRFCSEYARSAISFSCDQPGILVGDVSGSVVMCWRFWPYEPSLAPNGCPSGLVGNLVGSGARKQLHILPLYLPQSSPVCLYYCCIGASYAGVLPSPIWHKQMCQRVGKPRTCIVTRTYSGACCSNTILNYILWEDGFFACCLLLCCVCCVNGTRWLSPSDLGLSSCFYFLSNSAALIGLLAAGVSVNSSAAHGNSKWPDMHWLELAWDEHARPGATLE